MSPSCRDLLRHLHSLQRRTSHTQSHRLWRCHGVYHQHCLKHMYESNPISWAGVRKLQRNTSRYAAKYTKIRENTWKFDVFCTISLHWTHCKVHSIRGSAYFDVFRCSWVTLSHTVTVTKSQSWVTSWVPAQTFETRITFIKREQESQRDSPFPKLFHHNEWVWPGVVCVTGQTRAGYLYVESFNYHCWLLQSELCHITSICAQTQNHH